MIHKEPLSNCLYTPLIDWPNKIYVSVSPTVAHLFGKNEITILNEPNLYLPYHMAVEEKLY